jgi:hypothetical protein
MGMNGRQCRISSDRVSRPTAPRQRHLLAAQRLRSGVTHRAGIAVRCVVDRPVERSSVESTAICVRVARCRLVEARRMGLFARHAEGRLQFGLECLDGAAESAVVGSPSRPPSACPAPLDVCRLAHCRRAQCCHRRRLCPRRPQAGRLLGRTRRRPPRPMTLVRLGSRSASSYAQRSTTSREASKHGYLHDHRLRRPRGI